MWRDLETGDLVQINDVEWEILSRYASQTLYQIVRRLKDKYKLATLFEGIERLERLGQQGSVLSPMVEPVGTDACESGADGSDAEVVGPVSVHAGEVGVGLSHGPEPLPVFAASLGVC